MELLVVLAALTALAVLAAHRPARERQQPDRRRHALFWRESYSRPFARTLWWAASPAPLQRNGHEGATSRT
jgi:hypothetical protein